METWTHGGQLITDTAGAMERLGLPRSSFYRLRKAPGFPQPLPDRFDGRTVYAVPVLDAYASHSAEAASDTPREWLFDGVAVTNRAGAAERLGLARSTFAAYAQPDSSVTAPAGFPEPLPERPQGHPVYAIAALDAYRASREVAADPSAARSWIADDGELVTDLAGAAALLGLSQATVTVYASPGERDRRGFPAPHPQAIDGEVMYPVRALEELARQRGSQRRGGGRKAGPRPTAEMLNAVLAEQPDLTVAGQAAALSSLLGGAEVSTRVVLRLRKQLRGDSGPQ